ncbi:phage major tail tube protein [Klebsiella aerogenes]|uniref:phage major tail tube protein n=1 Tax=Klebsiella aerogenes TaxID=548 RepID=UPI002E34FA92|nr:phage major tail tube protein [Klebsiella aerogenes]
MNNNLIYSKGTLFVQNNVRVAGILSYTPPALVNTVGTRRTTWMDAPVSIDTGMEAMQIDFKVAADKDVLGLFGFVPGRTVRAQIRRTYKDLTANNLYEWVDEVEGLIGNMTPDEHGSEGQEGVGYAITMSVNYYKLTVDGKLYYEIDPINLVRVIDGVDTMAEERRMLGMG